MENEQVILFYKRWIEPFIAIGIIVMLLLNGYLLNNEHKLKEEISQNCGWVDEDYRCYCRAVDVRDIEESMNYFYDGGLPFQNVSVVE